MITSIGSTACASAAASPARVFHMRRTARNSRGTASVPASASGSFSEVLEKPTSLTDATCSHRSTGGLSIETAPAGLERAEEEVVPGESHAAHGRVVERVRWNLADVDQTQHRRRPAVISASATHVSHPADLFIGGTLTSPGDG